jgi:hypothetical protein
VSITTFTSREFNQDVGGAKKATTRGPVFVSSRGHITHVLLDIKSYQHLVGRQDNFIDRMGQPSGVENIEVEFPHLDGTLRIPDFS